MVAGASDGLRQSVVKQAEEGCEVVADDAWAASCGSENWQEDRHVVMLFDRRYSTIEREQSCDLDCLKEFVEFGIDGMGMNGGARKIYTKTHLPLEPTSSVQVVINAAYRLSRRSNAPSWSAWVCKRLRAVRWRWFRLADSGKFCTVLNSHRRPAYVLRRPDEARESAGDQRSC